MYEFVRTGELTGYIDCPAKIGVYLPGGGDAWLIDAGSDKDAGKKVLKAAEQNSWTVKGVINTHSHADHSGGNRLVQDRTGCAVLASRTEAAFINNPILEPAYLFGAFPPKELRHKFLLAQESKCEELNEYNLPQGLEIIPLEGHFFSMIGLLASDGTAFIADSVASAETLEKYKLSFLYDVEAFLKSLDRLEKIEAKLFVPSHAAPVEDIRELTEINRRSVLEAAETITELCRGEMFENILKQLFDKYSLTLSFEQYALVGSTVRSYLAWLSDSGRVEARIEDNRLLWYKI
jgi:glyoxylase-like metal-dependent hydrolase (beta-lactamase superfamily II)